MTIMKNNINCLFYIYAQGLHQQLSLLNDILRTIDNKFSAIKIG